MKTMKNQITCPKCANQIDVEQVLAEQIAQTLRADMLKEKEAYEKAYQKKNADILNKEKELNQLKEQMDKVVDEKVNQQKAAIVKTLRTKIEGDFQQELSHYKDEYNKQRQKIQELSAKELELQKMKDNLEDEKQQMALTIQKQVSAQREKLIQDAKQQMQDQLMLQMKDKDILIEDMKKQMSEMKRKMEQGSMQAQGETLEILLEELIAKTFPFDSIEEVSKGTNGADVIHTVYNDYRQICGKLVYEAKRTKSFSHAWIDKLKNDMATHKADIAILVTEVMPKELSHFGLMDGVWVCTYQEVAALSNVLRQSLIQIHQVAASQENKGDKMVMLYNYLTGNEFAQQIRTLVDSFSMMKDQLDKEKRALTRIWKEREKQIDSVLTNTIEIHASIRGIAGNSVKEIETLNIETNLIEA
jgi:hypothetical protein